MSASDNLHPGLFDAKVYDAPKQDFGAPTTGRVPDSYAPGAQTSAKYSARGIGGRRPQWMSDQGDPEQLKSHMTANEIMDKYQPLDADRQTGSYGYGGQSSYQSDGAYSSGSYDPREGSKTGRSKVTDTMGRAYNEKRGTGRFDTTQTAASDTPGGSALHPYIRAAAREGQFHSGQWHSSESGESEYGNENDSSNLWNRKYDESVNDRQVKKKGGADEFSSGYEHGQTESLRDSVVKHGPEYPIRLGETIGQEGMPEVVGGHHRLAVMFKDRPNDLMPVLHDESIQAARRGVSQSVYPYK